MQLTYICWDSTGTKEPLILAHVQWLAPHRVWLQETIPVVMDERKGGKD